LSKSNAFASRNSSKTIVYTYEAVGVLHGVSLVDLAICITTCFYDVKNHPNKKRLSVILSIIKIHYRLHHIH
jgi:hypothetical protein